MNFVIQDVSTLYHERSLIDSEVFYIIQHLRKLTSWFCFPQTFHCQDFQEQGCWISNPKPRHGTKQTFFFLIGTPKGLQSHFPIHFTDYCELTYKQVYKGSITIWRCYCQLFIQLKNSVRLEFSVPVVCCRPLYGFFLNFSPNDLIVSENGIWRKSEEYLLLFHHPQGLIWWKSPH